MWGFLSRLFHTKNKLEHAVLPGAPGRITNYTNVTSGPQIASFVQPIVGPIHFNYSCRLLAPTVEADLAGHSSLRLLCPDGKSETFTMRHPWEYWPPRGGRIRQTHGHSNSINESVMGRFFKNPAYGTHQLSRPMRIVGPIAILRGCVIYIYIFFCKIQQNSVNFKCCRYLKFFLYSSTFGKP